MNTEDPGTLRRAVVEARQLARSHRAAGRTHPVAAEYWITLAAGAESVAACLTQLADEASRASTGPVLPAAVADDGQRLYELILAVIVTNPAARTLSLANRGRLAAAITSALRVADQVVAAA